MIEKMKRALEAIRDAAFDEEGYTLNPDLAEAYETFRTAIEQAEKQGPVGQLQEEAYGRGQVMWFNKPADQSMLYTTPQQREWVGLTDEEVADLGRHELWIKQFIRKVEAKLKEKNHVN